MKSAFETIKDNNIGKTLEWCAIIISIIGILVSVFGIINKDKPKFEYDIVSADDFFNESVSVPSIKVLVEDTIDIQKNHKNITVYKIKAENKGKLSIHEDDYNGSFGLRINKGKLLGFPIFCSASDDVIKDFITKGNYVQADATESFFKLRNQHQVEDYMYADDLAGSFFKLPNQALNKNDNYIIKILVLHDIDSIPDFQVTGKIIGQAEIIINKTLEPSLDFWSTTFGDTWPARIIRFLIYFVISLTLLLIGDYLVSKKEENKAKKSRKKEINALDLIKPSIKEEYIKNGSIAIDELFLCFSQEESKITEKYRKMAKYIQCKNDIDTNNLNRIKEVFYRYNYYINKGYFSLNNDLSITFNTDAKDSIINLYEFLKTKRQKENKSKTLETILDNNY